MYENVLVHKAAYNLTPHTDTVTRLDISQVDLSRDVQKHNETALDFGERKRQIAFDLGQVAGQYWQTNGQSGFTRLRDRLPSGNIIVANSGSLPRGILAFSSLILKWTDPCEPELPGHPEIGAWLEQFGVTTADELRTPDYAMGLPTRISKERAGHYLGATGALMTTVLEGLDPDATIGVIRYKRDTRTQNHFTQMGFAAAVPLGDSPDRRVQIGTVGKVVEILNSHDIYGPVINARLPLES